MKQGYLIIERLGPEVDPTQESGLKKPVTHSIRR